MTQWKYTRGDVTASFANARKVLLIANATVSTPFSGYDLGSRGDYHYYNLLNAGKHRDTTY